MRKAPILNVLFGAGAVAEALVESFSGDLEASAHSLIAAGYNFLEGLVPYAPTLETTKNASKKYVNGIGAALNFVGGIADNLSKHIQIINDEGKVTADPSRIRNTRSISYAILPIQNLIALGANAAEAYYIQQKE
jgi:hypothetical protein